MGRGVYDGPDNAKMGHGMDQVYQQPCHIPGGGSYKSGSRTAGKAVQASSGALLADGAIREAFANGSTKW